MSCPVSIIIIAHSNVRTLPQVTKAVNEHCRQYDQKILVLNNPSASVEIFSQSLDPSWNIVHEIKPGPQHARNRGAQAAVHDYLVFLDDDVLLPKFWIDHMLSKFTSPEIALGQGYIQFEKNPSLFWQYSRYLTASYFYKLKKLQQITLCDTAAIIVKKNWFIAVKGFSPDLSIGEDAYFGLKLYLSGGKLFFDIKYSFIQIFDEDENYSNHIKKLKNGLPSILRLKQKSHQGNYISIRNFILPKFHHIKRPILLSVIHASVILIFEIFFNKYRTQLTTKKQGRLFPRSKKDLL